jgi:Co/Zn/Cd efflux system component
MMGCCDHQTVENPAPAYQRVLWIVLAINAVMFVVEAASGLLADSRALQADALDFLGDTATYGLTLWALGQSMAWRLRAARIKGFSLLIMGVVVLANSIWALWQGSAPQGEMMMGVAGLALVANVVSALLLLRQYEDQLTDIFIVSQVEVRELVDGEAGDSEEFSELKVVVHRADGTKCQRCWRYSVQLTADDAEYPGICPRCLEQLR